MKPCFCNKCHKRIIPPSMFKNINIAKGGKITLKCGDENCKGFVIIKG